MKPLLIFYVIVINIIGFLIMGIDKRRARHRKWRIPEKTMFLIALLFGSVGILTGMYVFRHKTRHLTFMAGIPVILALQLAGVAALSIWNRQRLGKPVQAVSQELNRIMNLDSDTITAFVSYENLVNSRLASGDIETDTAGAVLLFFQNFSYQIEEEQIIGDQAEVTVTLTNLDARALAEDLCRRILQNSAAIYPESSQELTTSDYYLLLRDSLENGNYELTETTAVFHLQKQDGAWVIVTDDELEDELVGGFISYMNDPYILPASEVLSIHLDALKALDEEQWMTWLSAEDIFATNNSEYYPQIDKEYIRQLCDAFDYRILRCTENGSEAVAAVRITSLDMSAVLTAYRSKLLDYASTTQSIRDDDDSFSDETSRLLLEALQENTSTVSTDVELTFSNDGTTWEIYFDSVFTDALMGGMDAALDAFTSSGTVTQDIMPD